MGEKDGVCSGANARRKSDEINPKAKKDRVCYLPKGEELGQVEEGYRRLDRMAGWAQLMKGTDDDALFIGCPSSASSKVSSHFQCILSKTREMPYE